MIGIGENTFKNDFAGFILKRKIFIPVWGVKIGVVITIQLSEEGVLTTTKLGVKRQKL